ncbi:MAG: hypothetical protein QOC56_2201 [Alphaproteobacteria bacterium]|nr:hypothetical protein [Alphaproteobacteria bacterium]
MKFSAPGYRRFGPSPSAFVALLIAALALAPALAAAQAQRIPEGPVSIEVNAQRLPGFDHSDPSRRQFGLLEFRGGLVLSSPFKEFGGLSAIRVQPDGENFIAVSDKGRWLQGRITYDGNRPAGIAEAQMAPVLGPDGRSLAARGWYDTESIAQDGGTLYLGIERVNRIVRLDFGKDGLLARAHPIDVPAGVRSLPNNKGLEALLFVPRNLPLGGTLMAFSERGLDKEGNLQAFLIGGPRPGAFAVKRNAEFDISDAAQLPAGDILILERKFGWTTGLFIRIRRLALADVRPGALVDGKVLFEADLGAAIDNMEGLSVHRAANGEIVLTMISDDNFSALQRTLLLQFTLVEP